MTLGELLDMTSVNKNEWADAEIMVGNGKENSMMPVVRISLVEDDAKRVIVFHRETIDEITKIPYARAGKQCESKS